MAMRRYYPYGWSFLGGAALYGLMVVGNSWYNVQALSGFLFGSVAGGWILFWQNKLTDAEAQKWLWLLLLFLSPIVILMVMWGGLLGASGILILAILPLCLWTWMAALLVKNRINRRRRIGFMLAIVLGGVVLMGGLLRVGGLENYVKERICVTRGGQFVASENRCRVEGIQAILYGLRGLEINVPGMPTAVSRLVESTPEGLRGKIIQSDEPLRSSAGHVYVQTELIYMFGYFLFVVPIVVEGGGSGRFVYMGLFSEKAGHVRFLDSVFLGDRVTFQSVESHISGDSGNEDRLIIHYLDRPDGASFIQTTALEKTLSVKILSGSDSLHPVFSTTLEAGL